MYNHLRIQNFKSVKELNLPLKRVNVLIGEPNTGKSNILEACALLGTRYLSDINTYVKGVVRHNSINELFYDKNSDNEIDITLRSYKSPISHHLQLRYSSATLAGQIKHQIKAINQVTHLDLYYNINESTFHQLNTTSDSTTQPGKRFQGIQSYLAYYNFSKFNLKNIDQKYSKLYEFSTLDPPFGTNLMAILNHRNDLLKILGTYFKPYGYKTLLNRELNKIQLVKMLDDDTFETFDISLSADTLLRMIYYDLAIRTNQGAFLLFEEPEAYSYPTYVSQLAELIANDTNENQYLITTHSPHLLYKLIDELSFKELNIIGTYYQDFQTKIKFFNEEELSELLNMGYDLFFGLPSFFEENVKAGV